MMSAAKQAVVEMVLLGVLSAGLAFGVNTVRKDGRIKPTKDYFAKSVSVDSAPAADSLSRGRSAEHSPASTGAGPKESPKSPTASGQSASPSSAPASGHLDHPYKEIAIDEVLAVMADPQTARGLNVFVDARNEDDYAEGHIPGAIRCFPYEIEKCINDVLDRATGAEKVIVYCEGGDCEDSIFMCRELAGAGVPFEAIYLYPGGWKEWSANNHPTQSDAEE